MSTLRLSPTAISEFFEKRALTGATRIPGANRQADSLARLMVREAKKNAKEFNQRTGELVNSVVPIVRKSPRSGSLVIGVGTTVKYGEYLEEGTPPHAITVEGGGMIGFGIKPHYFLRSGGPKDRPPGYGGPWPGTGKLMGAAAVQHPGNPPFRWMRRAVNTVMGRRTLNVGRRA